MGKRQLVITGWNCISPYGIGSKVFCLNLEQKRVPEADVAPLLAANETSPFERLRTAADFDIRGHLGRKSTRTLDRLTALTIATVGLALRDCGVDGSEDRERIGIVLGSSQGSLKSISGFTRETLIHERPEFVNPALFPNTVMNCAAGQTAIWHRCRGLNVTVSAGQLSALSATRFAMQALRRGYADLIMAGGAEEITAPNAWAYYHATPDATRAHAPLAEGCAMFAIETAEKAANIGRTIHAHLEAAILASYDNGPDATSASKVAALARLMERLLEQVGVAPDQVALLCKSHHEPTLAEIENAAIARVFGERGQAPEELAANEMIGNAISASTAFQLAMLLARFRAEPARRARYGLVLAMDSAGSMGGLLVRQEG